MRVKIFFVVALILIALFPAFTQAAEPAPIEAFLSSSTRLMVFSPHPDDETLGAGGLIQRVLKAGGKVKVVFMTNGDGYPEGVALEDHTSHPSVGEFRRYGQRRRLEALSAMTTLGVKTHDVIFLGFPDAGLSILRSSGCDHGDPYRSPYTREDRPQASERIIPRADFCSQDLIGEIERVIFRFKPSLVVTTAPEDQHPDHNSTYYFLERALVRLTMKYPYLKPAVFTFVIHYNGWPVNQEARSGVRLNPPPDFPVHGRKWTSLGLNSREVDVKRRAIVKYRSQMVMLNRFLLSFDKSDELFMPDTGLASGGCGFQMSGH
jgi:LmbE family N-acetylglucosaminyl deacetylase